MDGVPQENAKATDAGISQPAGTSPATANIVADHGDNPRSWGDKYADKVNGFVRNILGNYIVNFATSAGLTYGVVESKAYKSKFEPRIKKFSAWMNRKTGIHNEFTSVVAELFTVTQILLIGGHSLLPFMKWTHDNRHKLDFETGHKLDLLQETLGKGNATTKQNIEDYHRIHGILSLARHNRKERDPVAIPISDDDRALLAKNDINDDLKFNEHKRTWWQVLKARGFGVTFTTALSFLFATGSFLGKEKGIDAINVKKQLTERGAKFGRKVYGNLSFIKDPEALGKYTLLELIYTAASKLGFDHIEKRQMRKERLDEEAAAREQLRRDEDRVSHDKNHVAQDKELLADMGINPAAAGDAQLPYTQRVRGSSTPDARRKLLEAGEQDFRTREAAKPGDTSLAMS